MSAIFSASINLKPSVEIRTNLLEPRKETQVVIVGAGLAGLAAAQRLTECGISDFIVLDAQNRIGGRVFTVNHGDFLIELGAQWLHGAQENPLYDWLNRENMLDDYEEPSSGMEGLFCDSSGSEVDQELIKKLIDIMIEIKLAFSKNEYEHLIKFHKFQNAYQVFKFKIEENFNKFRENNSINSLMNFGITEHFIKSLFNWFMRYESIENGCDSMRDVSIASYTDWIDFSDGALLNFKQGYGSLLKHLCNSIKTESSVYLNKNVTNIEILLENDENFYDNKRMLVKYSDTKEEGGNSSCKVIHCDHVIVTSSIGFLKENLTTFFKPQLPTYKMDLIKSIGFGTVNKIILQFEEPFLDESNRNGIKLIWNSPQSCDANEAKNLDEQFPTWTRDIIAFDCVRRQPNLLIGWIGGFGAKQMEFESDENVGKICLKILKQFLPKTHRRPTKLISCLCSRWHSNKFTRGSYSFQSENSFEHLDSLHEPIFSSFSGEIDAQAPRIMFAGEATAGNLYSTAHGAIITGWREAERINDYQKSLQANRDGQLCQFNVGLLMKA